MPESRYVSIIEKIFHDKYRQGDTEVHFQRSDLEAAARQLDLSPPKNLGDIIYAFQGRQGLPKSILAKAPKNKAWVLASTERAHYVFRLVSQAAFLPNEALPPIKIPQAMPSIVEKYVLDDEQALLAKLRYNRLLDIFTESSCYSLQSHLRTTVPGIGQVEIDELYVGVNKKGEQFVFPVEAKSNHEAIGMVQIERGIQLCRHKFPDLTCRAIAVQSMQSDTIAILEFAVQGDVITLKAERHYTLIALSGNPNRDHKHTGS